MVRLPPRSTLTYTLFPCTTLCRSNQGFHVFCATPRRDALAEINRYSDVKLVLSDPSLGDLALSGSFKLGDGKAVSEALPYALPVKAREQDGRSEEHTSELQSLMRISYAVFCLKKKMCIKTNTYCMQPLHYTPQLTSSINRKPT